MDRQQNDHRLSSKVVHSSDDLTEEHHFLNVVHALPGCLSAGAVRRPKENSSDHLQNEGKDQRAAPDVSPTSSARHLFIEGLMDQVVTSGSVVEPCE